MNISCQKQTCTNCEGVHRYAQLCKHATASATTMNADKYLEAVRTPSPLQLKLSNCHEMPFAVD